MTSEGWRRCPHSHSHSHRHHQHHCPHCPLRRHCHHCPLHNPHFQAINFFHVLPQNPHLLTPSPVKTHSNSDTLHYDQVPATSDVQISQELEHIELNGEEEDDEPIFVLTDEWRDFFAKSEARRKLEKKQGKKGKK